MNFKTIDKHTLEDATSNAFKNSLDFKYEAELLYKLKSYGHSTAMAILGIEEFGKAIGYGLLHRFKVIPISWRINFNPDQLFKDLQKKHLTKQSIAIIFSCKSQFSYRELSNLKINLDNNRKTLTYNNKSKEFENFTELTKEFDTIEKWRKEIERIPELDKTKQSGFYVEITRKNKINIPKKMKSKTAMDTIKILKRLTKNYKNLIMF